jgi:hypothetical protein
MQEVLAEIGWWQKGEAKDTLGRMALKFGSREVERRFNKAAPSMARTASLLSRSNAMCRMAALFTTLVVCGTLDRSQGDNVFPALPEPRDSSRIKVERIDQRLIVRTRLPGPGDWTELATYVMETNSRPYLHPLRDASGRTVLTEDRPSDHPWQHGIFTGFHRVNGFNYWKEDEGKQRFVRLIDLKESPGRVSWRALVELVAPNGSVVLEEEDAITIHAPESADAYVIDFDLLLRAKEQDVSFGKFFVGGLAVRMPWDNANPRQTHLNSNGLRDRACEQQRAAWCNVERPFGDAMFGIAVFDHPTNPNHPSGWRADEQGLINPNVSALGDWTLAAKQTQRFRYRLLVYRGPATREQLATHYEGFRGDSRNMQDRP